MDSGDDRAINFKALFREERKRARANRRTGKESTPSSSPLAVNSQDEKRPPRSRNGQDYLDTGPIVLPSKLMTDAYRIRSSLKNVYYIPEFLHETAEPGLLRWLRSLPTVDDDRHESPGHYLGKFTELRHAKRRVALFDATSESAPFLPTPLRRISEALVTSGIFPTPPNHVLVNEYRPGEGILPHTDGPQYLPRTATISIGGSRVLLRFEPRRNSNLRNRHDDCTEVLLDGNGSCVVFEEDAYSEMCHSIKETTREVSSKTCGNARAGVVVERGYRVSLTFRCKR